MNYQEIDVLLNCDSTEIAGVVKKFLDNNAKTSQFPGLSQDGQRSLLWTALFKQVQDPEASQVHAVCLAAIRVLSRDATELEELVTAERVNVLLERAGLRPPPSPPPATLTSTQYDVILEALKCIYNLALNSWSAREVLTRSCVLQGLIGRLRLYRDLVRCSQTTLFDIKIFFILTALNEDCKKAAIQLGARECLVDCLKDLMSEASGRYADDQKLALTDEEQRLVCEILKVEFNLCASDCAEEEALWRDLVVSVRALLLASLSSSHQQTELATDAVNLLTVVPSRHYELLSPRGTASAHQQDGHDMAAIHELIQLLQYKLQHAQEEASPVLAALCRAAGGSRVQRRYLRRAVLPPLRDVSQPPERGATLRNRLCRLLTSPSVQLSHLAAQLIFTLCKEKVSRMVKYTGFGNAAGLLAQRGLLSCGATGETGATGTVYSSSSDDSDTDEYRAARDQLDPVVGCVRPPARDPTAHMSDEQKEYEAMKLVELLDKLQSSGVVQPARIGPDGKPVPIDHVLQLRDRQPPR